MRTVLPTLALAGCAGWNSLPHQSATWLDLPLWDPTRAVASDAGLYVPLPHAGGVALLTVDGRDGDAARIDFGEGELRKLSASPDGETLLAFLDRTTCELEDEDEKPPVRVEDCPSQARVVHTELALIRGDAVERTIPLDGAYNAVRWSTDGSYAIAYLDFSDLRIDGVINLTSVVVIDLARDRQTPVGVGFAADRVLFVEGGTGAPEKAVVLSQNSVALLDLLPEVPVRLVTFPLTLDPDTVVTPVGVALTPDGEHAMITVAERTDLYVLDLVSASINIVELGASPAALAVNEALDRTVITFRDQPRVDVLEHELFDLDTVGLDESMNSIVMRGDFAVLYDTRGAHDAYKLDLVTGALTEYRLQNPAVSLQVAPTDDFAIAYTRAENGFNEGGIEGIYDANPGMEVIDLGDDDSEPFLLEGLGVGLAWSQTQAALHALVLQDGADYLYQLDLYTGRSEELELVAPPVSIGATADGGFFITHESPMGLVTFLDPSTGDAVEVSGFGTLGLADPIELVVEAAKE